jgi:hypothetical protein
VVPSQIAVYLRDHHPSQAHQQRKAIQEEVLRAEGIAFVKHQVVYPDPEEPPIPGLPILKDRIVCKECQYTCRHRTRIQRHYKEQHNYSNPQKKERQKKGAEQDKMWEESQHCQRVFEFAQWKKYF